MMMMAGSSKNMNREGMDQRDITNKNQRDKDDRYNKEVDSNSKDLCDEDDGISNYDDKIKRKKQIKGTVSSNKTKGSPVMSSIHGNLFRMNGEGKERQELSIQKMNKNMLDVLAAAVASEPSDAPTNQRSKDGLNKINTDLCHEENGFDIIQDQQHKQISSNLYSETSKDQSNDKIKQSTVLSHVYDYMLPGHYATPPYPIDLYTAYRHLHHHHIPMLTPFHISIPGMAIGAPPGVTPLQYYPLYYPPGIPYNYPLHDRSRLVVSPPQREKGKELSEATIEITQENKADEIATNEVEKEQEADDNKHVNTTKNIKLHDSETEEDDEEEDEDEEYEDVTDDTSENDENSELKLTTDHPKCLESQSSLARDGKSIKKLDGAANARFEPPRKRKRMVKYSPDVQAEIDKMKMQDAKRFLGVNYHVLSRKFRSRIKILHKTTHLGYYETSQRAAMGYDLAAIILRGEGAKTNYYVAEYADLRDELAQIPGSPRTRCLTAARIPMEGEFGERNMTLRRVMIKKYRRKAKQPELDEGMKSR